MIKKLFKRIKKESKETTEETKEKKELTLLDVENNITNKELLVFLKFAEKYDIPEIQDLLTTPSIFSNEFKTDVFLKYNNFRDEYIEHFFKEFKYYKTIQDLETEKINITYFLNLPETLKSILTQKKILMFQDMHGKKLLGIYNPTTYFDFEYDEIFFYGNSIYNYFFGAGKDFFASKKDSITIEHLLQYMETNGINDIGMDPINKNQYIITAEVNKKNVLLSERPILTETINEIFHKAMTIMGIDHTTEYPTVTGLIKLPLVGKNNIHVLRTFRMNFIKVKAGYTASIRRFMNYTEIEHLGFDGLGYTQRAQEIIQEAIKSKSGINMILGETNSGKSTLLATILNKIYKMKEKIISIENPIEIEMPYLQIDLTDTESADENFKMTKEVAQKGILRHNPNVVLMSEIRTKDEIDFFAGLGLRGHMALATLHAGSVANAIEILLKVADEGELKSIVNLFIHQELLAKRCTTCNGTGYVGNDDGICIDCNKGVSGVVPIYEIIRFKHLDKEDSLKDLKTLIKNDKCDYISKVKLIKDLNEKGMVFKEDYERVLNNNVDLSE